MSRRSLLAMAVSAASIGAAPPAPLTEPVRTECYAALTRGLEDESKFVRVHAAEALVGVGRPELALAAFRPKGDTTEPEYRVVVWRVLAAAEPEREKRREYVGRIRAALLDPNGPDRTHAQEALAKLAEPAADAAERDSVRGVADGAGPASPFAIWRLAQAGEPDAVGRLAKLLESQDIVTRIRAVYVLGRLAPQSPATATTLAAALAREPAESKVRPMLRAVIGDERRKLLGDAKAPPGDRYFAAMFLADAGTPHDYPLLTGLLRESTGDLRVGVAYALLSIDARSNAKNPLKVSGSALPAS